jgi:tetratricopeptide (TPR) repeat protein
MRTWRPVDAFLRWAAAVRWTRRGRRLLARGDARGAIVALESALQASPDRFVALLHLSRAYLRCRDLFRAHRTLARARECDPARFAAQAPRWIAREGFDVDAICHGPPAPREPEPAVATRGPRGARRRSNDADRLRYGDCRDLDEYARFSAMPPISEAEIDDTDWDEVLGDLLDE